MGMNMLLVIASVCLSSMFLVSADATIEQKLRTDPDLSQFYDLITSNAYPNFTLDHRAITVFAPTNAAFQRYKGKLDESLVLYHIINLPKTIDQLGSFVTSEGGGNPPLWVTRQRNTNHDDIYINNAKILMSHSNYGAINKQGHKQVLHVIDEVLTPVVPNPTSNNPLYNPNAYQLLIQSESVDIGLHRLREFRQRVNNTGKLDIFNREGKYTFFMPVDEGFSPSERADMLDDKVIDGHVIPGHVLFTSPSPLEQPFETLAFGDNLKVTVSFKRDANAVGDKNVYVQSYTLVGDSKHQAGAVQAEIVRANIPVKNGVIHLIQRPLMIVDMKISEIFKMMKEDGPLFKFYEIMKDSEYGNHFMNTLTRLGSGTLFAPSNAAWQDDNIRNILLNSDRMREILNLHLVKDQRLSVERIKQNINQQVHSAADRKSLYFNVINGPTEQILTVEGGGVNATVIQADIAATDGVIHIIDKVLGVPHATVLDKLKTDPMLNDTYFLGQRQKFNNRLNDTARRYTYFVPRNRAWRKLELSMPSTIKKLFMPEFSYHAVQVLERHLVIADEAFTMEKLKQMAAVSQTNDVELPAQRDILQIRIEEKDKSFTIIWRNEKISVYRPDVECTNGVIHVIDQPFLQEGDIKVTASGAGAVTFTAHCVMLLACKLLLL